MRTVLYKSGFLRYFSSLLEYCQQGKRRGSFTGAFIAIVIISFVFLTETTWTWGSGLLLVWIAVYLDGLKSFKPNVVTLAPLSWKQRFVYSWLAPLLYFVLVIAGLVLVRVFFLLINSAYGLLVGFKIAPLWETSFSFNPHNTMGTYGIIFGLIFQLACYSAGMFISSIKKGGFKALFVFIFCAAIYLCLQLMSLPFSLTLDERIRFIGFFSGSPFYYICYFYMQYPWLSVVLCGVVALAFFGVTVWFTAIRNRGKDY